MKDSGYNLGVRRLLRILLDLLTLLLLVVWVGAVVLWVRSASIEDRIVWGDGYNRGELNSKYGQVMWVDYEPWSFGGMSRSKVWTRSLHYVKADGGYYDESLTDMRDAGYTVYRIPPGIDVVKEDRPGTWRFWQIIVPTWLIAGVAAILPCARGARYLKRRHLKAVGTCRTCGYDLRATPGRCPQCGATPGV